MSERIARQIMVHGKVQGVWFRAWTVNEAQASGLDGWVRNRRDGAVELLAAGPADRIATLIVRCHAGPPAARVDRVDVADAPDVATPGFTQQPTF